ncbi:MAG: nucleotide exchange factor GrpE [Planctomycetota bacterium]
MPNEEAPTEANVDSGPDDRLDTPVDHALSDEADAVGPADPVAEVRAQLADAEAKALRALADYQNFQRRAANNEREARTRGVRDVLESLLPVLDNADIALSQDQDALTVESLLGGVRLIRDGVVRAMTRHGVTPISPEPGDEFEPGRHEAIMQQPVDGIEPGRVALVMQVGYAISEQVVRPAKVGVAAAPPEDA